MKVQPPYLLFLGNATDLLGVKIANSIIDWRPELCVGELRLPECTITKGLEPLTLAEARKRGARTFVITMNNSGGYIEPEWVPMIVEALEAGFDVASGLHERLSNIPEIAQKADSLGRQLVDVRLASEKLHTGTGIKRRGKRLLTVGTDCSVGKMYASLALEKEMLSRGLDANFVATGQCGIFICGTGIAVDCVISDFISGAVEQLSPDNKAEHWDIIEGQGSLFHPSFAGVSLGLLHGAQPDALVLCHAQDRPNMRGMPSYQVPGLQEAIEMNLQAARLTNADAQVIGIAVNTSALSARNSQAVLERYENEHQLPCVDPLRTGVAPIVDRLAAL